MSEFNFGDISSKLAIIKMSGVDPDHLNDGPRIIEDLRQIADEMDWQKREAGVVEKFEPFGITAALVLGASLISIHTWPEHGKARFNIELCSSRHNFKGLPEIIQARFKSPYIFMEELEDNGTIRVINRTTLTPTTPLVKQLTLGS